MKKSIYSQEYKRVVQKLKAARKTAGIDQNTVAKKLGTTQSYISKIESGQCRIDVVQLRELAKIYKKEVKDFI